MNYTEKTIRELEKEIADRKTAISGSQSRIKRLTQHYAIWEKINKDYIENALVDEKSLLEKMEKILIASEKLLDAIKVGSITVNPPK